MMKLAYRVFIVTLTLFALVLSATAQSATSSTDKSRRSDKDDRNVAPTVGTGGPVGGLTGLFTVLDGETLRKGEWTLSAALSNFDRDPGNVDITELPVSFHIGLSNYFELAFTTDAYRGIKVNSPRNLSSFYLPNSTINGVTPAAIVLAPQGPTAGPFSGIPIFRPAGAPLVQFPYTGGSAGDYGYPFPIGGLFGYPAGTTAMLGPPRGGSGAADMFPGIGSVYGGILPGVVLQTATLTDGTVYPTSFTQAPSYLPDAPLINRTWGSSSFNTYTIGGKWRWTNVNNPVGFGISGGYRFYQEDAGNAGDFNMLQRGASPGASTGFMQNGDILLGMFASARVARWMNVSANAGYHWNGSIKAEIGGSKYTLLDRPDEFLASVGVDFPVNKYFQPIVEFRSTRYVGGRTVNAFENHPMDIIAGARIFPTRYFGIGLAYRYHLNQQGTDYFTDDDNVNAIANVVTCFGDGEGGEGQIVAGGEQCISTPYSTAMRGTPAGFLTSDNGHGYIVQLFAGRRNPRLTDIVNQAANVTAISLSDTEIKGGCADGYRPKEGETCNDNTTINVSTSAFDPEGDVLTYNYTVSGGRIVGSGANVEWDVAGLQPGTYTITAAVDDGCGFCGQPKTETITIAECDCVRVCECPSSVSVTGPAGVTQPGESMSFTANVVGGPEVTYNWTVSGGTIESGQGTPSISVRTSSADADTTITATVQLGGFEEGCGCQTEASDNGPVAPHPDPVLIDEFGRLANDDVRARLDQFFIELQNNPTNQGYIINYGTAREIQARERLIQSHITLRRLDRSRITMVRGGDLGTGISTKLYRVPPGAENPNP